MYLEREGERRGDLYAVTSVQIPSKLSDRQRQLYEMLLAEETQQD